MYHVQNTRLFWMIFLSIVLSISLMGSLALFAKRYLSFKANLNRVQKIHITLEDQNRKMNDKVGYFHNFNTHSYNSPLLSCFETNILFALALFAMALLMLPVFIKIDKTDNYVMLFHVEVIMEYIVGMVFPLYVLVKKETIRNHFWNEIPSLFC